MGLGLLSFTLLVSTEHLGRRIQAYRDGLKEAKPKGAFVNPRAAAFFMTHCAATDKQAREEAERAFLSYARTTLTTAIKVPVVGDESKKKYAHAQFEAADQSKLSIDYLIGEAQLRGRGLGTLMIASFVELSFGEPVGARDAQGVRPGRVG